MIVSLAAWVVGLAYLAAVPLKIAFVLRAEAGPRFAVGFAAFEGRFARRAAEARLGKPKRPKKKRRVPWSSLPELGRAARFLLRHVELVARVRVGFGDAALTALLCGALAALFRGARAASDARLRADVAPDFSAGRLTGEITGIATVRAGHIMLSALIGAVDLTQGRLSHGKASD